MQTHWEHQLIILAGAFHLPVQVPAMAPRTSSPEMRRAYELCAQAAKVGSKSFYLATSLLPAEKRDAVRVLYAFCRTVDDIVDGDIEGDKEQQLAYWRHVVHGHIPPAQDDPIALAWVDVLSGFHIPARYAEQLIDGVARDMVQTSYETFEDLSTYCYGVASTVGLMSMYIIGFRSTEALRYAINLGVALQLTNILRDVGEDQRNGRIYLPAKDLRDFGISAQDLADGKVTPRWIEFMKYQVFRVRDIYAEADLGIRYLDQDGQLAVAAASNFYSGILDQIEANGFDVFSRRASLNAWEKIKRVPALAWKLR